MAITQSDLITTMVEAAGEGPVSKAGMTRAYQALFEKIADGMTEGESINIRGFGTFSKGETKERTGRNPQTGETLTIAAGFKPKFKAGAALKARVNGK